MKITHSEYQNRNHTTVFIDSSDVQIMNIMQEFYMEHELHSMRVRSKAWNSIVRNGTKIIREKLAQLLEVSPHDIYYSSKAGCSCGCSPGYIVKNTYSMPIQRQKIWVKISDGITLQEVEKFKQFINSDKIKKLLENDLKGHYIEVLS